MIQALEVFKMNKNEILGLLNYLYADLDNKKISKDKVTVWFDQFNQISIELARKAAKYMYSTQKIYGTPKVQDFQHAVDTVRAQENGKPNAAEAFALTMKAISRFGYYQESKAIESLPLEVAQTCQALGWKELCTSTEISVIRAQFERFYNQIESKQKAKRTLQMIEGNSNKKLLEG